MVNGMARRKKTHENMTVSMERETVRLLHELAAERGQGFSMSRYVSNAVRERLLRDRGVGGK